MNKLMIMGRLFVAVAFIGLGFQHFLLRQFITGRAPAWPESIPGGPVWAYVTGIALLVVGAALILGRGARLAAIFAGLLIFFWALIRHIPIVATDSLLAPSWTQGGKALTFVGGALAIAGTLPSAEGRWLAPVSKLVNLRGELVTLGRVCLGIFLVITGIQHFMYTEFVASLIPEWFPGNAVLWTYFGGVALIAGGSGLLLARTAPMAALLSGSMVFSWFWIIHIPRAFASVSDGIAVFEALAVSGIAFVIAGFLHSRNSR
ncbi:MAG: DoxX family membrane protein [Thermoanaerobaculia bacterium]